jgi:hypothetical protein
MNMPVDGCDRYCIAGYAKNFEKNISNNLTQDVLRLSLLNCCAVYFFRFVPKVRKILLILTAFSEMLAALYKNTPCYKPNVSTLSTSSLIKFVLVSGRIFSLNSDKQLTLQLSIHEDSSTTLSKEDRLKYVHSDFLLLKAGWNEYQEARKVMNITESLYIYLHNILHYQSRKKTEAKKIVPYN